MTAIHIYKIIHLTGIAMTLMALGGLMVYTISGGSKADLNWRKPVAITHGVGLFLALLGGFGMLARMGIHWPWPGYIMVKFGVWIVFGGLMGLIYKKPGANKALWAVTLLLFVLAAYMALFKPF